MPRTGPRPRAWKIQGEVPHQQHIAWHRMRAQAIYRKEPWDLSFEQFQQVWGEFWYRRGRGAEDYCLTRLDIDLAWSPDNIQCIQRIDHLRRHRDRQVWGFYEERKNR